MDIPIEELKKLCKEALEALISSPLLRKQENYLTIMQYRIVRKLSRQAKKAKELTKHILLADYSVLIIVASYHDNNFK